MKEQEKALISKQFIETLLEVPVNTCPALLSCMETAIRQYLPDFLKHLVPFFLTEPMVNSFQPMSLYHITDFLHLNYSIFLYENRSSRNVMIIGPYLTLQPDTAYCEQVLHDNGLNASLLVPFHHYCLTLPVVTNSAVMAGSRTAIAVITGDEKEVAYVHFQPQSYHHIEVSQVSTKRAEEASMDLLEQRYLYEKLVLQEVAHGNQEAALNYFRQFSLASRSIVRTEDLVRTAKNLSFSLNTMLRKSAETAGIHPVFLDIISSNFAMLIEHSNRLEELTEFQPQMISAYCRFVQNYRLDQYSPLIRKAITYVHIHLADSLSLKQISEGIKVSPSYLSRLFNQEVHESISNYITRVRIEKAAELLSFTRMPVQAVAAYVGFSDLNYFSRCFKKHKNMTATAYRETSTIG